MPSVNITNAFIYNAAVQVSGVLTGSSGIPITAYTVEVIPSNGNPISIVINEQSSGGSFEYCGIAPNNEPIPLSSAIKVVTNRQAQDQKLAIQPCNPLIGFLPNGSYQLSCREIKVELTCQAKDGNGVDHSVVLDLTKSLLKLSLSFLSKRYC